MNGAARVQLQLRDLTTKGSVNSSFGMGIVVDSERGSIEDTVFINSPKQLYETFGKVNGRKYGISMYCALVALTGTSQLYVRRVDKGQKTATMLVRAKIEPAAYKDKYGFWIDRPVVDTILHPYKSMTRDEIESMQFPTYPNKRVVKQYKVPITLVKQPKEGDTKFWVDNVASVVEGDIITFIDTNEMTREESLQYLLYPVVSTKKELLTEHWLEIEGIKQDGNYLVGKEVKKHKILYLDRGDRVIEVATTVSAGQSVFSVKQDGDKIRKGDILKFTSHNTTYEVQNVNGNIITLYNTLENAIVADSVIKFKTEQCVSYQSIVKVESGWSAEAPKQFKVNSNDIVLDGDMVSIDGNMGRVVRKYNTQNYTNNIEVSTAYVEQGDVVVGSPIFYCEETDYEYRDAFLVYAKTPGSWGNKLSISMTPSRSDSDQFIIQVYEDGLKANTEEFEVCMNRKLDGYGRQLFIEDVVNNRSQLISIKINPNMIDENGLNLMPMLNTYYLKQPVAKSLYTRVADTVESVFDGDVKLTVSPNTISDITIDKKIFFFGREYKIASIVASSMGGALDTLVLESPINLNLHDIPFKDRFAPIGTPIYQSVKLQDKFDISVTSVKNGMDYSIVVDGKDYTIRSIPLDSEGKEPLRDPISGLIIDKDIELYWGNINNTGDLNLTFNDGVEDHTYNVTLDNAQSFNDIKRAILIELNKDIGNYPIDDMNDFNGSVTVKFDSVTKTFVTDLRQTDDYSDVADIFTDRFVDAFNLDDPANLDDPTEVKNTEASILKQLADAIKDDSNSPCYVDTRDDFIRITSKIAGVPMAVEVSMLLELEHFQVYARDKDTFPVERVDNSILPTANIGAIATFENGDFYIVDAGTNRAAGGDDDWLATAGNFINSMESAFSDPDKIPNITVLLQGGVNSIPYAQALNRVASRRRECIAMLSIPFDSQAATKGVAGEVKYRQTLAINSNYATLCTPWVEYYDADNDTKLWIPPDAYHAVVMARQDNNGETFKAPAGWNRGNVLTGKLYKNYSYDIESQGGELGVLQDNQINGIRFSERYGYAFWGQKTLQVKDSALTRINSMLSVCAILKSLRNYLENEIYEFNNDETRQLTTLNVTSFMDSYVNKGAIESFQVICDSSNNPDSVVTDYQKIVDVFITLFYSAEVITGRLTITRSGVAIS